MPGEALETATALSLTQALIRCPSVTPDDNGCQDIIAGHLLPCGFTREDMHSGNVSNVLFKHGNGAPMLLFAGHTDVVPPGPEDQWETPPFEPVIRDGVLFGRGAADMKSGVASMAVACRRLVSEHSDHRGSIALLLTSDEEGPAIHGTRIAVQRMKERGEIPAWCLVGEPSAMQRVGDVVKNGRRGSLNGHLTIYGKQGHVAYPDKALNPIHSVAPVLTQLCAAEWDSGNEHFPPTQFQISDIHAGVGASNVIPGTLKLDFNFRYATVSTPEDLRRRVEKTLNEAGIRYDIHWENNAEPFLTPEGELLSAVCSAVKEVAGYPAQVATTGGTSDGRFIAKLGCELAELGVVNESIHQVNERVRVDDIEQLSEMYLRVARQLLIG